MKIDTPVELFAVPTSQIGVLRDKKDRLIALLKENCLSYSEIGVRLGVSRERIRQLAWKLNGETGQERSLVCTINRKMDRWNQVPFVVACRAHGLCVEPEGKFLMRQVRVEGQLCIVTACSLQKSGLYWSLRRPQTEGDYYAFDMKNGDWLILTDNLLPARQTLFAKELAYEKDPQKPHNNGSFYKAHHYRDYINAWHIFKGEENEHQRTCGG